VTDFPLTDIFSQLVADPRFPLVVAISILAGAVRGFSGFGSAMVYIPLMSMVYGPQVAVATFVVIDLVVGVFFVPQVWRKADYRQIVPLTITAILAAQFGTLILLYMDPSTLRWAISALVGLLVLVLASGWRYHGRPTLPVTLAVGSLSGFVGGAVQISGPPIILYWLGSSGAAATVRANFIVYFSVFSAATVVIYALHGLLPPPVLALAIATGPFQIASMALGGRLFDLASEKTYRRVAYGIITASAVAGLPIWDSFLR
jgi:uncharacterized membrane protein YfcA